MRARFAVLASAALLLAFGLFFADLVRRDLDSRSTPMATGDGVVSIVTPTASSEPAAGAPSVSSISGTVLDGFKLPIANASVRVVADGEDRSLATRTEANGSFRFEALLAGVYALDVESESWGQIEIVAISVGGKAPGSVELLLQYEGRSSVEGNVVYESPDVLAFTSLWLAGPHRAVSRVAPLRVPLDIDEGGGFECKGLPPGQYDVEGTCKGKTVGESFVIRRNGERATVEIDLLATVVWRVSGRAFLDDLGHPLASEVLSVVLATETSQAQLTITTSDDGSFEFDSERLRAGTAVRFFREEPSARFVELTYGEALLPYEVIFESRRGRAGLLLTKNAEEIPFADLVLQHGARDRLYHFKTTDEAGGFPADDLPPGPYSVRLTTGTTERISTEILVSEDAETVKIVLPIEEYFVLLVSDADDKPIPRGYLYHVSCPKWERDLWDIRPFSASRTGVSGSLMGVADQDPEATDAISGATILDLPSSGECTFEVLLPEYGWSRVEVDLAAADRHVPIRLTRFQEVDVIVSRPDGTPVDDAFFHFVGFHENAPLFPGGGGSRGFFSSMPSNLFVVGAKPESGEYRVRLAPGSQVEIESRKLGRVIASVDELIRDGRVVVE